VKGEWLMSRGDNKFTARVRNVLSLSQQAAQRFQQNYIGPEHLLLGLLRSGRG
jgi:ATP-dependent Clp protease ATP-binding subunit ClpC